LDPLIKSQLFWLSGGELIIHLLALPNDLSVTFCRGQTCRTVVVLNRGARIRVMQNRTAKIGIRAALHGGCRRGASPKHMRAQFYAHG
jgi:hypothetical protein